MACQLPIDGPTDIFLQGLLRETQSNGACWPILDKLFCRGGN